MKTISYWIRGYFGFSQKEASGFIILSLLIIIALFAPPIYNRLSPPAHNSKISDQQNLKHLIAEIEGKELTRPETKNSSTLAQKINYFKFDPNTASESDFQKLNVQKYIAERIVKFRAKGGKFRIKKDLKKIYGFSELQFQELRTFILLPDSIERKEKKYSSKQITPLTFDINKADTIQLNKLKGIANIMSARIIKYRDKLGGFVNKTQLSEVYSISPLALEELEKRTFIEKNFIPEKLNVNTASAEILATHPYLGKKSAMVILNYRAQHGKFENANDLRKIISIPTEQLEKLEPYFAF
jgi:competence protein ComEA